MPGYRPKVPHVILIEPIRFPFFVIDFNGPAMASDAGDSPGLPLQCIPDEGDSCIRQVSFSMIDDQSLLPKIMDGVGFTITVIGLFGSFRGD